MYEVELKAGLKAGQAEQIKLILQKLCTGSEVCIYFDTYFDTAQKDYLIAEKELRLRKITGANASVNLLTFKEPPFDEVSKSKIEHEVQLNDYEACLNILEHLGLKIDVSFEKQCINYNVTYNSVEFFVTLATIQELEQEFIEVEIQTGNPDKIQNLYGLLHEFLLFLNIAPDQLTNEYYTDMVRDQRKN